MMCTKFCDNDCRIKTLSKWVQIWPMIQFSFRQDMLWTVYMYENAILSYISSVLQYYASPYHYYILES